MGKSRKPLDPSSRNPSEHATLDGSLTAYVKAKTQFETIAASFSICGSLRLAGPQGGKRAARNCDSGFVSFEGLVDAFSWFSPAPLATRCCSRCCSPPKRSRHQQCPSLLRTSRCHFDYREKDRILTICIDHHLRMKWVLVVRMRRSPLVVLVEQKCVPVHFSYSLAETFVNPWMRKTTSPALHLNFGQARTDHPIRMNAPNLAERCCAMPSAICYSNEQKCIKGPHPKQCFVRQ